MAYNSFLVNGKTEKHIISIIFLVVVVDLIGFGILIPVIPQLLANPNSSYYLLRGSSPGMGYFLLGVLTAVYPIMQFLAAPILGQLSDRYGRKKLLAISVFGTFLSYLLFAIGIVIANLPLLFVSRAIDGLTGGNISIAQAAMADITKPENRAKNFGLIGAAFGLGFILGPFLGGKLSDPSLVSWFTASTPFFFAAALSFAEIMIILYLLPETLEKPNQGVRVNVLQSLRTIADAVSYRNIRAILGVAFLDNLGFTFFTTFIAVFYIVRFGFDQGSIGNMFAYVGLTFAAAQLIVLPRLPKNRDFEILFIGILGTAAMLFVYVVIPSPWYLLLAIPVFSVFNGFVQAYLPAVISRSSDRSIQGRILGINASMYSLGQAIPPVLAGYLAAAFSPQVPLYVASIVTFATAGVLWAFRNDITAPLRGRMPRAK
ncbi:MAG: MFS transporter [Candidatus Micrarchaeota archaeon]|nr:MFS transporter [Candidatus Micrarchaeota archaeon]